MLIYILIQQDHQTDFWTGGREASSQDFHRVMRSESLSIMEELAPSEMKEETSKAQPEIKDDGGTPGPARCSG
jgi:hypothetical protein